MSEDGGFLSTGIPPLRRVIDRPALLAEVLEHSSSVTVMAAPGGYGKTTVAAQVAHQSHAPVVWLDCSGIEGPESLAALVRDECAPDAASPGRCPRPVAEPEPRGVSGAGQHLRPLGLCAPLAGSCWIRSHLTTRAKSSQMFSHSSGLCAEQVIVQSLLLARASSFPEGLMLRCSARSP